MTPDQISKAIALELGWKPKREDSGFWSMTGLRGNYAGQNWRMGISESHCWQICNQDFCNNYDAAAEMRKAIKPSETAEYLDCLNRVLHDADYGDDLWSMLNSTPRQQAESFLRMRGKWVEV